MPENITNASEYFLQALEAQRSINSHIHEIEPSTPIFLYEIDLNEIKPATVSYPNTDGPVKDGVIRIHNDFNLFNINRGIITWRGNQYFPFPVYGEQFDITSNGTIPTPKVKFSSQFLDDEFNSFYKYIRMQIQELKDIVGSKVTRRKTFVRYLSPDNFPGNVNPFNAFIETPWASRAGETLTVRSLKDIPINFSKWLIYTMKSSASTNKIFTCLRTDDRLKTLDMNIQKQNYTQNSLDFFNLLIDDSINLSPDVTDSFSCDVFIIPGNNSSYTNIINDTKKEFTKQNTSDKIKAFCCTSRISLDNSTGVTINYPSSFSATGPEIVTLLSFKSLNENAANSFNHSITSQSSSNFTSSFSKTVSGNYDVNYLAIPTGIYTGVNQFSNEDTMLTTLKLTNNFGSATSGEYNVIFPTAFSTVPKILFNSWGNSGFKYNQYLKNISSTGCTFVATHTGDNQQLHTQNIHLIATDYITDESSVASSIQIYTSYQNMAVDYINEINTKQVSTYEVELTPDIYYIDRKVQEDSQNVIYELASLLDIEGIKLPGRILLSKNCSFTYRGEGCLYERSDRLNTVHSGVYAEVGQIIKADSTDGSVGASTLNLSSQEKIIGLKSAPPVATQTDNTFSSYVSNGIWIDKGAWQQNTIYNTGNFIHIEKNYIKYYFVSKGDHTSDLINCPPNSNYWESDSCSKTLKGCRLRWKNNFNFPLYKLSAIHEYGEGLSDALAINDVQGPLDANGNQLMGVLPFGGFPSVEGKFQSQQGGGG